MTDLEMKKLCAEAIGFRSLPSWRWYDPLVDDAQAMALVKKHGLQIRRFKILWQVEGMVGDGHGERSWKPVYSHMTEHLNRAIVECVAKMQAGE